jgi:hypothetical protein
MFKSHHFAIVTSAIFALSACGGGGASSDNSAIAPTALATDAYKGTWQFGPCASDTTGIRVGSAAGAPTYQIQTYTSTANTATSVTFIRTIKTYAPTDTTCAGTAVMTQTLTPQTITFSGTAVVSGQTYDKVVATSGEQMGSLVSGGVTMTSGFGTGAMTINGYYLPANYFTQNTSPASTSTSYMRATSTQLFTYDTANIFTLTKI